MALYIKIKTPVGTTAWFEWHTGEPLPPLGRVVEMQADGDELEVILHALSPTQRRG